jgi:hypothetical protein
MSTYAKLAAEAGDQYLEAMGQTQDTFLSAVTISRAWAPAMPATPIADFPTPQEMVDVSFGFAQKLLKQQQDFVEKLMDASEARGEPTKSAAPPKGKSSAN